MMNKPHPVYEHEFFCERKENKYVLLWESIKTSFKEFLLWPSIIILFFLILSFISHAIDAANFGFLKGFVKLMEDIMFVNNKGTNSLLGAIVAGVMTIATFTITMLLIVVQQSASSLSSQVFDRFLRSKSNQTYFGFFLGLSFFALIQLATVNNSFNPVIGATLVFILTLVAFFLLIVLVYTTINQMRSGVIIDSIYEHIIKTEKSHLKILESTLRTPRYSGKTVVAVSVRRHGYLVALNLEKIGDAIKKANEMVEVEMLVSIGSYVPYECKVALVKASKLEDAQMVANVLCSSVQIERRRDISRDPLYGISQLENIGWTSISTAKSKPHTGSYIIRALGNVLLYWGKEKESEEVKPFPIVYQDNVKEKVLDAFENLGVVSSESMQHQSFYRILNSLGLAYHRQGAQEKQRIESVILTLLSVLGEHALTHRLDQSLTDLAKLMESEDRIYVADAIKTAHHKLKESVGKINSRSTRV
ncbi:MAG: DUF2254 family protein [Legionella sp.]|nr:DUF2254 family protein [Legionella sp.]